MTSTEFTVGLGEGARISSKVLKPPGGGSSDIFGLGNARAAGKATIDKQSKYEDSHSRVFGAPVKNDVQANAQSPVRNGVQSNVENGNTLPVKQTKKTFIRRNPITGEEVEISVETENEDKSNCDNKEDKDEETQNTPVKPVQTSIRIRNPPGGKSSGIF